ncbi:hypothetical protein COLO4_05906 [Corchorus olitorius]|uniref:Uncharacterized protein n=1 Tax=Corchorus olitorius TaxID=93759 RepID=A0A1R3KPM7_9ROSI|nr:hypothetical protein COLO4_05906 [Corchorus olitorius]
MGVRCFFSRGRRDCRVSWVCEEKNLGSEECVGRIERWSGRECSILGKVLHEREWERERLWKEQEVGDELFLCWEEEQA